MSAKRFIKFVLSVKGKLLGDMGMAMQVGFLRPYDWAVSGRWYYHMVTFDNPNGNVAYEAHVWMNINWENRPEHVIQMCKTLIGEHGVPDFIQMGLDYPPMTPDDPLADGDLWNDDLGAPNIATDDAERGWHRVATHDWMTFTPDGFLGEMSAEHAVVPDAMLASDYEYGSCCSCGSHEDVVLAIFLPYKAPVPGTGWGCSNCGQLPDGAIAVLCETCAGHEINQGDIAKFINKVKFACVGLPGDDQRMPITELTEKFWHDEQPETEDSSDDSSGVDWDSYLN